MRKCNGPCGLEKSIEEFPKRKLIQKDGLNHICKKCDLVCANCHRERTFIRKQQGS